MRSTPSLHVFIFRKLFLVEHLNIDSSSNLWTQKAEVSKAMGSTSSDEEIKSEVQSILQRADLSALSERNVREILSEKFGDAVRTEHVKKLITVRLFLCCIST